MLYPKLKTLKEEYVLQEAFGGIYAKSDVPEGKFSDMLNLTSDSFPLMKTRNPRAVWTARQSDDEGEYSGLTVPGYGITAVSGFDGTICYCTDSYVVADGTKITDVNFDKTVKNRCAVPMGRNLFIVPDGEYLVLSGGESEVRHGNVSFTCPDSSRVDYCIAGGYATEAESFGKLPSTADSGTKAVATEDGTMYLYEYSDGSFVLKEKVYIKLMAMGIGSHFEVGDTVFARNITGLAGGTMYSVREAYANFLVLDGVLTSSGSVSGGIIERKIPVMDFAVEHNNRIWGCRYGLNNVGDFVNEIYASALGDPTKWYSFEGVSTDSYSVSLGCSGEFTGAVALGNEVLFFKENYIIRITGSEPSDFYVYSFPARGVEKGDSKSIVNLNEKVFYKSSAGITVYDGALPFGISQDLGSTHYTDAVAGAFRNKYYIAMTSPDGVRSIFVYDTENGQWFKEDDVGNTRFMVNRAGCLYFIGFENSYFVGDSPFYRYFVRVHDTAFLPEAKNIFSSYSYADGYTYAYEPESDVEWYAETGKLDTTSNGGKSIVRSIDFTLALKKGAKMSVSILPDGQNEWKRIFIADSECDKTFSVPVATPPCRTFRLKFEGRGEAVLYKLVIRRQLAGRESVYAKR